MSKKISNTPATYRAFAIRGREDGTLLECELREPTRDEIRIKVAFVGICGSDLHYYFDGANGNFVIKEPLVPGHEVSGIIDVDPLGQFAHGTPVAIFPARPGTLVAGLEDRPHLWKGVRYLGSAASSPHTQGAMAEYIYVTRDMVCPLPTKVSVRAGALAEPLAVALHGARLAGNLTGKSVLISGSGPIGLLSIVAARSLGAKRITATDIYQEPLERAKKIGADTVVNVSTSTLGTDSFDVALECSGSARALNQVIAAAQRGGTIVQVGMLGAGAQEIEIGLLVTKELRLFGSFRFAGDLSGAVTLLAQHPELEESITDVFDLMSIRSAFDSARDPRRSGKVLVSLNL